MGFALSAVRGEDLDDWGASLGLLDDDRGDVEHAVGALGEVRDEDYYRLAVRFEVLSLAADIVVARSLGQKLPRHFGPDVYGALIDAEIDGAKKRSEELS